MNNNLYIQRGSSYFGDELDKIEGHFDLEQYDLGNMKYGVDIFTVSIRGKNKKLLNLDGVYRHGVIRFLESQGVFYKEIYNTQMIIHKKNNIIKLIEYKELKDIIVAYLKQLPALELEIDGISAYFTKEAQIETFYRQINLVLNSSFLEVLKFDVTPVLRDQELSSFLCFSNCLIKVSQDDIEPIHYKELNEYVVWKNRIIDFPIGNKTDCKSQFEKFISNVCSKDVKRINAMKSAIGYLLHAHNRPSGGQIVILYDEQLTDMFNPQGGTGKGVIANAIKALRNTVKIDGKIIDGKNRFAFQEVQVDTEVVWVDDVGKNIEIDRFNSISTDGFNVEQKNNLSFIIPANESPKIILCSNIIMDCTGTTRKRRQFIIELSSFYSSMIKTGTEEPIVETHGGRFFSDDWNEAEWNSFFWFMIDCLAFYLKNGLVSVPSVNVIENKAKQQIGEDMYDWIEKKDFQLETDYFTQELFNEFIEIYGQNQRMTQRSFSNSLKRYFTLKELKIQFDSKGIENKKVSYFRISN